jgi:hypothetical protein
MLDAIELSAFDPGADTVTIDSVDVRILDPTGGFSCGVELDSNTVLAMVNYARIRQPGLGLGVCSRDPATTGDFSIHRVGYVSITNSVLDGAYTAVHVHADSLRLENDSIRAVGWGVFQHPGGSRATQWLWARNVRVRGLLNEAFYVDSVVGVVHLARTEMDSTQRNCAGCSPTAAVEVRRSGALWLDSSVIRDNYAGAVFVQNTGNARGLGNSISGSYQTSLFQYSDGLPGVRLDNVRSVLLRQNVVSEVDASGLEIVNANGDTVTVDSNTVRIRRVAPSYSYTQDGLYGVRVFGDASGVTAPVDTTTDGTVVIRGNVFKGTRRTSISGDRPVRIAYLAGRGVIEGNAIDSTGRWGAMVEYTDTAVVNQNIVTNTPLDTVFAVNAYGLHLGQANGNTVTCAGSGANEFGVTVGNGNGEAIGNTVSRCGRGVRFFDAVHGTAVVHAHGQGVLRGNTVTRDGGRLVTGVLTAGRAAPRVQMVGNTVQGVRGTGVFAGGTADSISQSLRIDSNVVTTDTLGGIDMTWSVFDTVVAVGNTLNVARGWGMAVDSRRMSRVENNNVTVVNGGAYGGIILLNANGSAWYGRAVRNTVAGSAGPLAFLYSDAFRSTHCTCLPTPSPGAPGPASISTRCLAVRW